MGDENEDYRIKPEAAVKFFVAVSSAGIGLIAALVEKWIATAGPTLGPITAHSQALLQFYKKWAKLDRSDSVRKVFFFLASLERHSFDLVSQFVFFSVVFFVLCIVGAFGFYIRATVDHLDQRNPLFQKYVLWCAFCCFISVVWLALAAVFGLLGAVQGFVFVIPLLGWWLLWAVKRANKRKAARRKVDPDSQGRTPHRPAH